LSGQRKVKADLFRLYSYNTSEGMNMVSSRNITRRQKTHNNRAHPEKEVVQLPTAQGEMNMYTAQTRGKSHKNRITILWRRYYPDRICERP
jgi:hypothetical protein